MKRNTRIIQISGIRGLLIVIFTATCLAAGFIGFPAIVAMKAWNFAAQYVSIPLICEWQGLLLWAIVAISGFIVNDRKKFLVAFKTPDRLSEKEMKTLLERMKIQSQTQQAINSMILKSGDVKPVEKVNKSEEKSEKEKENV